MQFESSQEHQALVIVICSFGSDAFRFGEGGSEILNRTLGIAGHLLSLTPKRRDNLAIRAKCRGKCALRPRI